MNGRLRGQAAAEGQKARGRPRQLRGGWERQTERSATVCRARPLVKPRSTAPIKPLSAVGSERQTAQQTAQSKWQTLRG